MHALSRVLPVVLGLTVPAALRAQAEARPPLFAPSFVPEDEVRTIKPVPRKAAIPVSDRVRSVINDAAKQVLEDAVVFAGPATANGRGSVTAGGATVMAPVIVRETTLREDQVRPPEFRLYHFTPAPPDKERRLAGGATASLFHTYIGSKEFQIDLSLFNLAGNGIDHNIDFARAEIAFRFKW